MLTIRSCTPAAFAAAMIVFGARIRREPRNVLGDRSGQQLDILRQIADMLAERLA